MAATNFRLSVLGHTPQPGQETEQLTVLAEFGIGSAVARAELDRAWANDLAQRVRNLRAFLASGHPVQDQQAVADLGDKLFRLVIRDAVLRLFDQAAGGQRRHVPLEVRVEDPALATWPWEFLYDAPKKWFICQEFNPVHRSLFGLDGEGSEPPQRMERPRVLVVVGAARDDPGARPTEYVRHLEEILTAHPAGGGAEIEPLWNVAPEELAKRLATEGPYAGLHFYGHAGLDAYRKEGFLRMEQGRGKSAFLFYANAFAQLLALRRVPFVFLDACETGVSADEEAPARSAVAAAVLARGIPAVVATQFKWPTEGALLFSSLVYTLFGQGRPLVEAVAFGRQSMTYSPKPVFCDWGIPVLFTTEPDLILFPGAGTPPDDAQAGQARETIAGVVKRLPQATPPRVTSPKPGREPVQVLKAPMPQLAPACSELWVFADTTFPPRQVDHYRRQIEVLNNHLPRLAAAAPFPRVDPVRPYGLYFTKLTDRATEVTWQLVADFATRASALYVLSANRDGSLTRTIAENPVGVDLNERQVRINARGLTPDGRTHAFLVTDDPHPEEFTTDRGELVLVCRSGKFLDGASPRELARQGYFAEAWETFRPRDERDRDFFLLLDVFLGMELLLDDMGPETLPLSEKEREDLIGRRLSRIKAWLLDRLLGGRGKEKK